VAWPALRGGFDTVVARCGSARCGSFTSRYTGRRGARRRPTTWTPDSDGLARRRRTSISTFALSLSAVILQTGGYHMPNPKSRWMVCDWCGVAFAASRIDRVFCGPAHQRAAHREKVKEAAIAEQAAIDARRKTKNHTPPIKPRGK